MRIRRCERGMLKGNGNVASSKHGLATARFDEEEIICTTAAGEQRYSYEQVFAVVSDMAWYVIFFDASHGIILDKNGFSVGDARDFKAFIGQHTQLPIQEY